MEFFAWASKFFDRWWAYLSFCADAHYSAHVCKPFWENIAMLSIGTAMLLIFWPVWKYIDYRFKYAAAIRAELERERWAEPEEMEKVRWVGNDPLPVSEEKHDEALVEEIRAALLRRKLGTDSPTISQPRNPV